MGRVARTLPFLGVKLAFDVTGKMSVFLLADGG
jgi:hypothetical protein